MKPSVLQDVTESPGRSLPDHWLIEGREWEIAREPAEPERSGLQFVWDDPAGSFTLYRDPSPSGEYLFAFFETICIRVSLAARRISYSCPRTDGDEQAALHCLLDQVLPRVISHERGFVLHGAAAQIGGRLALFLGGSGEGKSTLAASLQEAGFELVGDDALLISRQDRQLTGEAVYRSLRLYSDAISSVLTSRPSTAPMAPYSTKRVVHLADGDQELSGPHPIGAMFFLNRNAQDRQITAEPMRSSEICMGLVANSFALDPTDAVLARKRLAVASMLANAVPGFALSYPHDFALLPEVHQMILAKADQVAAQ